MQAEPKIAMEDSRRNAGGEKTACVNNREYLIREDLRSGRAILELAGFDTDKYDLFLVRGQKSERIRDDQPCRIKDGMQFHAILKDVQYG